MSVLVLWCHHCARPMTEPVRFFGCKSARHYRMNYCETPFIFKHQVGNWQAVRCDDFFGVFFVG